MDKGTQYPILFHYVRIVRKKIKLIAWMMAGAVFVVGGWVSFGERTYTARATFLTSISAPSSLLSVLKVPASVGSSGISSEVVYHLIDSSRMAQGVVEHFRGDPRFEMTKDLTVRRAHRMINAYEISQGALMGVEVTSADPLFSKEVANFCVDYLNTINEQLGLTTDKPMVKMLDPAEIPTTHNPRNTLQKSVAAALLVGLLGCLFFTLQDYFKALKKFSKPLSVDEVLDEEGLVAKEKRS